MCRCPLGSMPLPECAGPDTGIWPTSSLVICPPTWVSVNLGHWEWRQMISFPWMESIWQRIFCFLKATTWWDEIETTCLIRWWSHRPYLSQASMAAGSSGAGCTHGSWIAWLLLLIVCLESLDSITGSSITAWIRRNHWRSHWAPWSTTRTAEIKCLHCQWYNYLY